MRLTSYVAFVLMAAGSATAQPVTSRPDWLKKPTAADVQAVMPRKALEAGADGSATIGCVVTVTGTLRDCQVRSETPADMGFGAAALGLAPQFLMKPGLRDGQAVESRVNIPIAFSVSSARSLTRSDVPVLSSLVWRSAPTAAEVMAAWPENQKAASKGGVAVLDCEVQRDGDVRGCRVLRQEPYGGGFAAAALRLADRFKAGSWPQDLADRATARTHITFSFPASALSPGGTLMGQARIVRTPTAQEMIERLPAAVRTAGVAQPRVVSTCEVQPDGALGGCVTVSEDPPGLGLGAAAGELAKVIRVNTWTPEGLPTVGGTVTFPLRFDLSKLPPAPPP